MRLEDKNVRRISFSFWYGFSVSCRQMGSPPFICDNYGNDLMKLVNICIQMLRYPRDYHSWTDDQEDDFKHHFREDVGDILLEVCSVVGPAPVLMRLAQQLQGELGKDVIHWHEVEAVLHGLRAVGKALEKCMAMVMVERTLPRVTVEVQAARGSLPGLGDGGAVKKEQEIPHRQQPRESPMMSSWQM